MNKREGRKGRGRGKKETCAQYVLGAGRSPDCGPWHKPGSAQQLLAAGFQSA